MSNLDLDAIKRDYDKARETISDLCHQRKRWIMSIPARPDHDPDLLIGAAIGHGKDLIAEVERLRSYNEDADGTDYAHPSYWRGSDAAYAAMCEQLRKILDGEDDCKGKCQEPWDSLRRRVLALRQELATAKRVGAAECAEILEKHAAQYTSDDETSMALSGMLIKIAAELRAEVGG